MLQRTDNQAIVMPKKDTLCPLCGNHIIWTPELEEAQASGNFKCPRCNRKVNIDRRS